jgi:Flp pilus assembly protein TadG
MLHRSDYKSRSPRRGAAAAELGLVLTPVLAFILVAGTDFARLFNAYLTITSCARNGALYGCLDTAHSTDTSGIQTAAQADASTLNPLPDVSSTTTTISGNTYVSVTVTYKFRPLINYPAFSYSTDATGAYVSLSRTVKMRVIQSTPN